MPSKYQKKTRQKARPIHLHSKTRSSSPITAEGCQDAQPMLWTRIQQFSIYSSYWVDTEDCDQLLSSQWVFLKNLHRGHCSILSGHALSHRVCLQTAEVTKQSPGTHTLSFQSFHSEISSSLFELSAWFSQILWSSIYVWVTLGGTERLEPHAT